MSQVVLNDRYVLESELGRGGMGVVYRAKDQQLDRHVAVKILPAEFSHDPQFLDRFKREILSSARLDSAHIVQVYDVGQDDTTNYYVMQLVEGSDLHSEIQKRGAFSLDETVRIIRQVAEALDHAHSHGIVHRDIKPDNILLDANGNAHVFDFGIAKTVEGTRMTGGMIGTPEYMSPEQARGEDVDGRSDQYSLAIVAYEMLTGSTPFRSDTAQPWALVNKHISETPPDPRLLRADLPGYVTDTLMRALAKVPAHRFDTCLDFASALAGKGQASNANGAQTVRRELPKNVRANSKHVVAFVSAAIVLAVGAMLVVRGSGGDPTARESVPISARDTLTLPMNPSLPIKTLVSAPEPISASEMNNYLDRYIQTWNDQDLQGVMNCLDPGLTWVDYNRRGGFKVRSYSDYIKDKREMFGQNHMIVLQKSNVKIVASSTDRCTVSFRQYYKSDRVEVYGTKEITVAKSQDGLKATRIVWRPDQ